MRPMHSCSSPKTKRGTSRNWPVPRCPRHPLCTTRFGSTCGARASAIPPRPSSLYARFPDAQPMRADDKEVEPGVYEFDLPAEIAKRGTLKGTVIMAMVPGHEYFTETLAGPSDGSPDACDSWRMVTLNELDRYEVVICPEPRNQVSPPAQGPFLNLRLQDLSNGTQPKHEGVENADPEISTCGIVLDFDPLEKPEPGERSVRVSLRLEEKEIEEAADCYEKLQDGRIRIRMDVNVDGYEPVGNLSVVSGDTAKVGLIPVAKDRLEAFSAGLSFDPEAGSKERCETLTARINNRLLDRCETAADETGELLFDGKYMVPVQKGGAISAEIVRTGVDPIVIARTYLHPHPSSKQSRDPSAWEWGFPQEVTNRAGFQPRKRQRRKSSKKQKRNKGRGWSSSFGWRTPSELWKRARPSMFREIRSRSAPTLMEITGWACGRAKQA